MRGGKAEAGIDKEAMTGKSATVPSTTALPTEEIGAQLNEPNSTEPLFLGNQTDENGNL